MAGEITEFPNARSSGTGGGHKQVRAPKIKVKSVPGKPLKIDMEPNDAVRLLSAFGTTEAGFANLMLSGIINAACSKRPGSEDVNDTLAAVMRAYAESASELLHIDGHGLAGLWNKMIRQIKAAGFEVDDEYTIRCGKLVKHLHDVDPDGERFRYPTSLEGVAFDYTEVNLKGLALAQWHICSFCEGSIAMLGELGRQAG